MSKFSHTCFLSGVIGLAIVSNGAQAARPLASKHLGSAKDHSGTGQMNAESGFKVIHFFAGTPNDGSNPNDVYAQDPNDLYLTTYSGGETGYGTVSCVHQDGSVTILHSFGHSDPYDGKLPTGHLYVDYNPDSTVAFAGTTSAGGLPNYGTIFEVSWDGSQYYRYYDFQGSQAGDGRTPQGGLATYEQSDGQIVAIGTTTYGGDAANDGTVFKFTGAKSYTYSLLHRFSNVDGANPYADAFWPNGRNYNNNILVDAADGGAYNLGTITVIDGNGNSEIVHSFAGSPGDGAYPEGKLFPFNGYIYGTTVNGGSDGLGTIFRIKADGSGYSVLYSFKGVCCGRSDGSFPHAGLISRQGLLYGTTINGGSASDLGTLFKFDPKTKIETVLHAFTGGDGAHPYAPVDWIGKTIYGTTSAGGTNNNGVLFQQMVQ